MWWDEVVLWSRTCWPKCGQRSSKVHEHVVNTCKAREVTSSGASTQPLCHGHDYHLLTLSMARHPTKHFTSRILDISLSVRY